MLYHSLLLILAIGVTAFSANLLVSRGTALGHILGVPQFVIGAVVLGFGSSLPELSVNIGAALQGNTGLAIGNILGSNVFNFAVVLGLVALIRPVPVGRDSRLKDVPMHVMAVVVLAVCGNQLYLDHINYHEIMPSHGIIMLCFFCIYLYYTLLEVFDESPYKTALHRGHHKAITKETEHGGLNIALSLILGMVGLVMGGDFIVEQAVEIAELLSLDQDIIGLLIVGPGTSVPELIACLVALHQRNTDMVVGNIIGSNLFNIFVTLGVSAMISPLPLNLALNRVILLYIAMAVLFWLVLLLGRGNVVGRPVGATLLLFYGGYVYLTL